MHAGEGQMVVCKAVFVSWKRISGGVVQADWAFRDAV